MIELTNEVDVRSPRIVDIGNYWAKKDLLAGMVMEEAAELIQAINKHERRIYYGDPSESYQGVIDEIGDLLIILQAYCFTYGIDWNKVEGRINYKLGLDKEV